MPAPRWSVALMCYNEAERLREAVERTLATMRRTGDPFEVLVIDDGSTDGSGAIADALAAAHPEVRALHHPGNQGIGSVLIDGYRRTSGEVVAIIPADLQFAPEDLPAAMARMNEADVVNIVRARRHDPWRRTLISAFDRMLVRLLFGLRVSDLHWVKLYRRRVLDAVTIESTSPMVDTELLVKAHRLRARIVELPLPHHPRTTGKSTGARLSFLVGTFLELVRLALRR